jgi:hypothetical protein
MVTSTGVHIVKPLRRASGVRWLDGESRIDTAGGRDGKVCVRRADRRRPLEHSGGFGERNSQALWIGRARSSDWTYGGEGSMRDETMMSKSVLYMSMRSMALSPDPATTPSTASEWAANVSGYSQHERSTAGHDREMVVAARDAGPPLAC